MIYDTNSKKVEVIETDIDQWCFNVSETTLKSKYDQPGKYFKEKSTIPSQQVIFCSEFRINDDRYKFEDQLGVRDVQLSSFAPLETLHDEFGASLIAEDPETLDDSDLELLAGDLYPDKVSGSGEKKTVRNVLLAVSHNMLKITSCNEIFQFPFSIVDCTVKRWPQEDADDILVLLSDEGILYALAFDRQYHPIVLQWWRFPIVDGVPQKIFAQKSSDQFTVASDKTLKFLMFTDMFHFRLISNLNFGDGMITDASFLDNGNRNEHFMLLVALEILDKVSLCLVQWGGSSDERKEVHPLTLLNSESVTSIVPLDDSRCLAFTDNHVKLVTANQILSGEHAFETIDRSLFGERITKCFECLELLSRLQNLGSELTTYVHCTVFATSNGALCCCLCTEEGANRFLALTRFKGLFEAFPVNNNATASDSYSVVISSHGSLIQICLDLNGVHDLSKDNQIQPLENIINKRILFSGHNRGESVCYVAPSSARPRAEDRLCVFSRATISVVSHEKLIQSVSVVFSSRSFKFTSRLQVLDCAILPNKWKNQFLDAPKIQSPTFLLLDTNAENDSRLLLVELSQNFATSSVLELDDVLSSDLGKVVAVHTTEENFVQVTTQAVIVDPFDERQPFVYRTNLEGTECAFHGKQLVLWNAAIGRFLFVNDLDNITEKSFVEFKLPTEEERSIITGVIFHNNESGENIVIVISNSKAWYVRCSDIVLPIKEFTELSNLHVHYGNSSASMCLFSDMGGNLFKLESGPSNPAGMRLSKLDIELACGHPWNIRHIRNQEWILFSPRAMFLLDVTAMKTFEIFHSGSRKHATIIDLKVSGGLYFVLFSDALEIQLPSSSNYSPSTSLLKSARTVDKQYLHLQRINRMLIVNKPKKTLECLKLENGRLMTLDSRCFKEFRSLLHVVELSKETGAITLIAAGSLNRKHWSLKLIQILPFPGRLVVRELASFAMPSEPPSKVKIVSRKPDSFVMAFEEELHYFRVDSKEIHPVRSIQSLAATVLSLDASDDMTVVLTQDGLLHCECREITGGWRALEIFDTSAHGKSLSVLIISHECIAVVGELLGRPEAPGYIYFLSPANGKLVHYNDVLFADRVLDISYSWGNRELCVLLGEGTIVTLENWQNFHSISNIVGKRERIDSQSDSTTQIGCWGVDRGKLIPLW
ncbi:LADA_0E03862g1_1 [Lachancea dasiensis]|uniref:LADA_0E03862g1_1 n=1 Tax=Lachancea dasiensis TaxID=1072105 RepID=A0A1G4JBH5_9SACH|nr:LADA_0E03862g1_1 [Lachancea dasiensis]